jgi:hypothetical protein
MPPAHALRSSDRAGTGDAITYPPAFGGGEPLSAPVFLFRVSEINVSNTSTVMVNIDLLAALAT